MRFFKSAKAAFASFTLTEAKRALQARNYLIGLYLKPDEYLEVAPPAGFYVGNIKIFPGTHPVFEWEDKKAWLKFRADDQAPYWDVECNETMDTYQYGKEDLVAHLEIIVESFGHYFPFPSSNNFLTNNGNPIA